MAPLDLEGLEFKRFNEIQGLEEKLSVFLYSLSDELKTWRDYVEIDSNRKITVPIDGHACLDGDKIVAIEYFHLPKSTLARIFYMVFPRKIAETGAVVKKEYQGRGINKKLRELETEHMLEHGYDYQLIVIDNVNKVALSIVDKVPDVQILKKTGKATYFKRTLKK